MPSTGTSTNLNGQPAVDLSGLTADEEFQAGTHLRWRQGHADHAAANSLPGFAIHLEPGEKFRLPNTGNNDKNPQRIQPRNLFDAAIGEDNIFNGDRYRWSLRLEGVNIANKYALYNFLSTFSGTHYVTPRALSAEIGFHF